AAPIRPAGRREAPGPEPVRRDAWVRELAEREQLLDVWALIPHRDLIIADGIDDLEFVAPAAKPDEPAAPADPAAALQPTRGRALRGLHRRAHLRVTGETDMHLALRAAIAAGSASGKATPGKRAPRPQLDVVLDGELLTSVLADDRGGYTL